MFLDGLKFEFEHTNQSLQELYKKDLLIIFILKILNIEHLVPLMKLMILLIKLINTFYILG